MDLSYGVSSGATITAELEIKRSRFLCYLQRTETEHDAREFIAEIRHLHPTARHHCTAFRIGEGTGEVRERSSDDGEPSGTAGSPMLPVLRGEGLVNVCAVVVRYFGGVLLGTGGLVRAYTDAVVAGLAAAQQTKRIVSRRSVELWSVEAPIADVGRWEADLRGRGIDLVDVIYGVGLDVVCPETGEVSRRTDPLATVLVAAVAQRGEAELLQEYISALSAGSREPYRTGRKMRECQQ